MATTTIFGCGGFDPLATAAENQMNFSASGKNLRRQYRYQKRYAEWKAELDYNYARMYAQNSASWQVAGLRQAGLNPILAAQNGNFSSTYGQPASDGGLSSDYEPSNSNNSVDPSAITNFRIGNAQADLIRAQKKNVEADTKNKINTGGLTGKPAVWNTLLEETGLKDVLRSLAGRFGDKHSASDGKSSPSPSRHSGTPLPPAVKQTFRGLRDLFTPANSSTSGKQTSSKNEHDPIEDLVRNVGKAPAMSSKEWELHRRRMNGNKMRWQFPHRYK